MTSQEDICDNVDNNNNDNIVRQQLEENRTEQHETQKDVPCAAAAAASATAETKGLSSVNNNAPKDDQNEVALKIVFVGACCTGAKTCLLRRIVNDTFDEMTPPTIGAAFNVKKINVDGISYRMEMWGLLSFFISFHHIIHFCLIFLQQILLVKNVM